MRYRRGVHVVLIGLGGFAGAIARYLVDGWVSSLTRGGFPWGTLAINASGSFVLGLLAALTIDRSLLSPEIRGPVMIGFIGAYTTFSTWLLESSRLSRPATGPQRWATSAARWPSGCWPSSPGSPWAGSSRRRLG